MNEFQNRVTMIDRIAHLSVSEGVLDRRCVFYSFTVDVCDDDVMHRITLFEAHC